MVYGIIGSILGFLALIIGIICGADPEGRGTRYFLMGVFGGGAVSILSACYTLYRWLA